MLRFNRSGLCVIAAVAAALGAASVSAAEPASVPFKLGTFRAADREYLGLVLNDATVVDIRAANQAWESRNA